MTPMGAVGSACAIGGSYLYAMTKHAEKQALDKKKQDDLAEKDEEVYEDVVKALPFSTQEYLANSKIAKMEAE